MGEEQIQMLKDTFLSIDSNGDGLLTLVELKDGIYKMGLEVPEDLQQLMQHVDIHASGTIDYTEFIAAAMDRKTYIREDLCWAAFRILDKTGDGKICKAEIAAALADEGMKDSLSG